MHPYLFEIFGFPIGAYGVLLAVGILAGIAVVGGEAKRKGISLDTMGDLNFFIFLAALAGGRLAHVLLEFDYYRSAPKQIFLSREGFIFYGGLLAGVAVLIVFARRKRLDAWKLADSYAVGIPLAHVFGRIGCFFAGCCFGGRCEGGVCSAIAVRYPEVVGRVGGEAVHSHAFTEQVYEGLRVWGDRFSLPVYPVQLMEAVGNLAIFLFLFVVVRKRARFDGAAIGVYAVLYSVLRFSLEFLRGDARGFFGALSTSQWICIPVFAAGVWLLWWKGRQTSEPAGR